MTKIGLPETRLGIIPGAGGTQRAVRLLGLSKTKDLIFTARMLTSVEAHEYGGDHELLMVLQLAHWVCRSRGLRFR